MTNIALFIISVILYYVVYELWFNPETVAVRLKMLGIIALLCLPVNIGGHVLTVFGNAHGEKGVYSVASFYQESESGNTNALLSSGYQRAAKDATTLFGVSVYQEAGNDALTLFGVSGYAKAGRIALVFVGVSGYQRSNSDAAVALGISGYQHAENEARTFLGLALYQRVRDATRAFGVWAPLRSASYKEELN